MTVPVAPLGYRQDADWQAARADYLDDERAGETSGDLLRRRLLAAVRMDEVQQRYLVRER